MSVRVRVLVWVGWVTLLARTTASEFISKYHQVPLVLTGDCEEGNDCAAKNSAAAGSELAQQGNWRRGEGRNTSSPTVVTIILTISVARLKLLKESYLTRFFYICYRR